MESINVNRINKSAISANDSYPEQCVNNTDEVK